MDISITAASSPGQQSTAYTSEALSSLRAATKEQHQILDKAMPLAKDDANWLDYVEHLQLLAAWLIPLEQWLSGFNNGPQGPDAPVFVCYSDLINAELGESARLQLPVLAVGEWSQNRAAAYRWGISYVIEGSQLGGEFLYQRLAARLFPHPLHYLKRKHQERWREFLQVLAKEVTTPQQISSACDGAVDAFAALLTVLRARD